MRITVRVKNERLTREDDSRVDQMTSTFVACSNETSLPVINQSINQ